MNFEGTKFFEAENLSCQNQCTHRYDFRKNKKSLGANAQNEKSGEF